MRWPQNGLQHCRSSPLACYWGHFGAFDLFRSGPPSKMNISCFGISHQTANVEVRERFAIPDSSLRNSLNRLAQMSNVDECVLLSTCNRTEFYLVSRSGQLDIKPF